MATVRRITIQKILEIEKLLVGEKDGGLMVNRLLRIAKRVRTGVKFVRTFPAINVTVEHIASENSDRVKVTAVMLDATGRGKQLGSDYFDVGERRFLSSNVVGKYVSRAYLAKQFRVLGIMKE